MAEIFRKSYKVKLPKSQHEVEEFSAKKGLVLCEDCGACYYKKHWHAGLEKLNLPETMSLEKLKKEKLMRFVSCSACTMIKNKQYEGRVTIKNFPENQSEQLEKLAEGFGNRAYDRDPMDRVIEIKKLGNGNWQITTTENELANKLAHKIKDTFNKLKSEIKFAPEPSDVAEITIKF
jgi:6-pyruvoyl-tetrahydropterin synthase